MKIKILQLNFWHGGELFENIIQFIKTEKPDIITCQEVLNGDVTGVVRALTTLEVMSATFDYLHVFSPLSLLGRDPRVEQGLAVLSRFPLAQQETIFFDSPYRYYPMTRDRFDWSDCPSGAVFASIKTPSGDLRVGSVHGIWSTHGRDSKKRDLMIDKLIAEIDGKERTIVAGDFNMNPDTEAISRLEKNLSNVFGRELTTTFNLKYKPKTGGWNKAVVDMMFVSPDIKVVDHYCPKVDISDHLPMIAVIEV